jgi:hypothetical protein
MPCVVSAYSEAMVESGTPRSWVMDGVGMMRW